MCMDTFSWLKDLGCAGACALALLVGAVAAFAQAPQPSETHWNKIIGAWNITYEDKKLGTVKGYVAINAPNKYQPRGAFAGILFHPDGEKQIGSEWYRWQFDGTTLKGDFWPYLEGLRLELQLADTGDTLVGTWIERGTTNNVARREGREGKRTYDDLNKPFWYTVWGKEIWTRAVPNIRGITVIPLGNGALDYPAMQEAWKHAYARANRPYIALDLRGENLPLYLYTWREYFQLGFDDPSLDFHMFEQDRKQGILRLLVWLKEGVQPGPKTLTLNGVTVPWELRFDNYSAPEEPTTVTTTRVEVAASRGYHVTQLNLDYGPWRAKQESLQSRLRLAEGDLSRYQSEFTGAAQRLEDRKVRAQAALASYNDARAKWEEAERRAANYTPPDEAKSDAYRKLERAREALKRRVDRLWENILSMRENRQIVPQEAFDNHDRLSRELDDLNAQIERMGADLGFKRARQQLVQAAQDTFVAMTRAESERVGAVGVINLARADLDKAEVRVLEARDKVGAARQALTSFASNAPRIGGVRAEERGTVKYETTVWDPSELLKFLDEEIGKLGSILDKASGARRDARSEFLAAQAEAIDRLDKLRDGIIHSAVAQGVTELAFTALDVVEKTIEAGPIGALGEGAKKVVEAAVLGPPSFYEPSLAPDYVKDSGGPFSDITSNVKDALKYSAKRGFKSLVTGPAASVVVKKYIESRSMRVYLEAINEAVTGSIETGYRIAGPSQGTRAVEAFASWEKARDGLKKAKELALFRNFGKLGEASLKETLKNIVKQPQTGKIAASVVRDLEKMATKKALAEWLEGVPLAEYMVAEAYARVATQVFLAASGVYWDARDPYEARVEERHEVWRQYDPKNQMRIITSDTFKENATLLIVLHNVDGKPLPSAGHRVTVRLGGKKAAPVAGSVLAYELSASSLADDGKGGVTLEAVVED